MSIKMMSLSRICLVFAVCSLVGVLLMIPEASARGYAAWRSHDFEELPARDLYVNRNSVVRGFGISSYNFYNKMWNAERFQKILDWGFNTIMVEDCWWGKFEKENGGYQQGRIDNMKSQLAIAKSLGLKVIISLRVCVGRVTDWATDWSDGISPTHDYANVDSAGRIRYRNFVQKMASEFPYCLINVWAFPYHATSTTKAKRQTYYSETLPLLINAVKAVNTNPVVVCPIHQAMTSYDWSVEMGSYSDIILGFGHTVPQTVCDRTSCNEATSRSYTDRHISYVSNYVQTHGCTAMSVEYAPLKWNGKNLDSCRLNALRYSIDQLDDYQFGFIYHRVTLVTRSGDNLLSRIIDPIEAQPDILAILQGYEVS